MVDHPTLFAQMALKFADHPGKHSGRGSRPHFVSITVGPAGFGGCSSIRRFADRVHHTDQDSAQR